jgi:hypothetical protein
MLHQLRRQLLGLANKLRTAGRVPPTLRIIEVDDAAPLAADLFFRAFRQPLPDFRRHFVLVREIGGQGPVALGYVHHTQFESGYLAGGLVVDAWKFRRLAEAEKEEIRRRGGMAEWLMAQSCRLVRPCDVVFAYIGDAKSLTVNTRVGFRATAHPHLYVLASPSAAKDTVAALVERVAGIGPF